MVTIKEIVGSILHFTEDEFFAVDYPLLSPRESQLLSMDFGGIAVNAPRQISTEEHDKLPLLMAIRLSGERGWDIPLRDNCILVGMNLQDGSVHFANALISEKELQNRGKREKEPKGPKPSGLAIAAVQLAELDPKGRLPITWDTGTWALGVIYYDWPSNTVVVELEGDKDVTPSPAMPVRPDPDPRGAAFLPCYLATDKTPKFPESGLTFTGEFKVEDGKQHLNIYGSFAVPIRDFHLPAQKLVHQFDDGRQENVAAVVPVTFAVVGLDYEEPIQFDWAIPIYGEPLAVGMLARGCFAINALANVQALSPGKYVGYLIMDGRIFGPKTLQIN